MTTPAAIAAQLVDMRNVGAHKSLKLTLHVPEEYALHAIEAFGWPTGANPVPVALARLRDSQDAGDSAGPLSPDREAATVITPPVAASRSPRKPAAPEKRLAQQAGICCADPVFQKFMGANTEDEATLLVRRYCDALSRAEFIPGTHAGNLWERLHARFLGWRDHDMPAFGEGEAA